jgi:hypothetical protein
MECYMMSRQRARMLAEALKKMHPTQARRIDADVVRIFCASNAEAEENPTEPDWLDHAPIDEISAWIDIDKLLR